MSFDQLTPDSMILALEKATGERLTGYTAKFPSYINRVYEFRTIQGVKLIAKFYRPGRWSEAAILDEHQFIKELHEAEVPVVVPQTLLNNQTIDQHEEIWFAVFPKKAGRELDITGYEDWLRLGTLVARMHNVGSMHPANARLRIHPSFSTSKDLSYLCSEILPARFQSAYTKLVEHLIQISVPLFADTQTIRIHGDLHRGNILNRLDEGLMLIDFDDMAMGPPVQDLWLLLPDRAQNSTEEIELFIEGYEQFRNFDRRSLKCIESLRAMRMVYFLAWCSRQIRDIQFRKNFPDWGTDSFWQKEINELEEQLKFIER
ncbi:MAG: serine/threonine protein kinase [Fibrobacter sp.]|nr:serine/threonine protein kinase [Fibrobacter sp.]